MNVDGDENNTTNREPTMYAARITISTSQLRGHLEAAVGEMAPCQPEDVPPVIVEVSESGRVRDIVDGFHRAAGFVAAGLETVEVIACRAECEADEDIIATAAEPGEDQDDAIAAIVEAAE